MKIIQKRKIASYSWSVMRFLLLTGISYTILYPILAKLSLIFMDYVDLKDFTVKWVPKHFTLSNITMSVKMLDYGETLFKTIAFCLLIALLQIAVCTCAAYSFGRNKSVGRSVLFVLVLATLLIPPQTYIVTLYTQFQYFDIFGLIKLFTGSHANILDSSWTFILLAATGLGIRSGLYIYVAKQAFAALPHELEEAAEVDGAGTFRTFFSVMLPNVIPTVVLCFILSFVWQWNDTFYTGYFGSSIETLSMKMEGINGIVGNYLGEWSAYGTRQGQLISSVALFLCAMPLIIIFVLCQRFFVQGVERSGLVG